ncbi:hypothetical protein J6590_014936 [Homalodisca vitripennis]|nr:hypothetical protein J6590_014936 [Homalodisca vitripennis]
MDQSLEELDQGGEFDQSLFKEFLKDPTMSILSVNPVTGKQEFICPRCTKVYSYPSTLLRHLKFECGKLPMFPCPHCPFRSHRKENIKSHVIAKHEKSKKIKCPQCTKSFVHKFRLLEHIKWCHESNVPPELEVESSNSASMISLPRNAVTDPEDVRSPLKLGYFPEHLQCSTPKLKISKTISVMDVPKINKLNHLSFLEASDDPQDRVFLKEEECGPLMKQEVALDITDSEDPLHTSDTVEDNVQSIIF